MDGLHLVSPSPVNLFEVDQLKSRRGPPHDNIFAVKPYIMARSFSGSSVRHRSRNKTLANSAARLNELSGNASCQNSLACSDSSGLVLSVSNATNSSDISIDNSKVDKASRKNARKRGRKKGKQQKKRSCDSGSTELEGNSEEYVHGSSTSETCATNDMDHGDESVSCATAPSISLLECRANGNFFGGDSNGIINCSEIPKRCTSLIDEVDVSEGGIPSVVQNFTGENPVNNSESGLQTEDPVFTIFNGEKDTCCKQISCNDVSYSKVFSDIPDSLVSDSVSVDWNSDDSANAGGDEKTSNGKSNGISSSEPAGYSTRKGCFSHLNSLNGVADSYSHAVGTCSQVCNSSDIQLVLPGKRGKQVKRLPRNSSIYRVGSFGNLHGSTGKENNHSVWQKVQKNGAAECDCELKKPSPACLEFDVTLKEAPLLKKKSKVMDTYILSKTEDKNKSKVKASRKLKRKTSPGSKQEYNCFSMKGSQTIKASSNAHTTINLQQNEILNIPAEVNDSKGLGGVLQISSPNVGFRTTSEPVHSTQVHPDELEPLGYVYNTVSAIDDPMKRNQNCPWSKFCDSLNQSNLLEAQSSVYISPVIVNEVSEVHKGVSIAEYSKQDHNSGFILQKWIPVGIKDPELTSLSKSDSSSLSHLDETDAKVWASKNIVEEELVSNSQSLVCSINNGVICMGQSSGNVNCFSEDDDQIQKLMIQNLCIPKEQNNKHAAANCSVLESTHNISAFVTEIAQAVNDGCRVRLASEVVQMTTGSPIAEFERLLHSASPVIQSPNAPSCQSCLQGQVISASLCRHETPNVSLGSLWQWYEKHGSYGLEVRAEDCENSKRLGADRFVFRAYFVPLLSAVQLFGNRKSYSRDNNNGIPGAEVSEAFEMGEMSEDSFNVGRLPIFSVLIPQPHAKGTNFQPVVNQVCSSELSSVPPRDDFSVKSDDTKWSDDSELLFEYFESEQPQQREPLFEKIKELIRGDGQCKGYGDPTKLDSMDLRDLHPRSWYSVAWYPIYKIPDGNFRAAFLTYHSLGHLVRRSATFDSPGVDASIVSPVVGLQSYNAQGECWFQLKHSEVSQTAESQSLNPSGILKERLRTLEHTASLMARAVVSKGNLTSVNRHPDYEFFLSRRRW